MLKLSSSFQLTMAVYFLLVIKTYKWGKLSGNHKRVNKMVQKYNYTASFCKKMFIHP